MPAPVIDRHGNASSSGGTTTPISITTGAANTLVLVMAAIGGISTTVVPGLSIAGAGLTWHAIDLTGGASGPMGASFQTAVQMWWGIAAAQLTSQVVTVTSTQTIDDASTVYASFTGAYAASPVDPNAGAVVTRLNNAGSVIPSGVFSSTNPNDICVLAQGANQPNTVSASAPVSIIDFNLNGGGARYSMGALALQTFTTPQSNVTVGYTNSNQYWGMVGAMLTADATVVAGTQGACVMVLA